MTQVLWQKSKREAMNKNQDLQLGEMLLLSVYSWSVHLTTTRKFNKFSWIK